MSTIDSNFITNLEIKYNPSSNKKDIIQIFQCKNLKVLNIEYSDFSQESNALVILGQVFQNCQKIEKLVLRYLSCSIELTDEESQEFKLRVETMKNLRSAEFDFQNLNISLNFIVDLIGGLGACQALNELGLKLQQSTIKFPIDIQLSTFLAAICQMKSLTKLKIDYQLQIAKKEYIDKQIMIQILDNLKLSQLQKLEKFQLILHPGFIPYSIEGFIKEIQLCQNLKQIDLQFEQFYLDQNEGLLTFGQSMRELNQIRVLSLDFNNSSMSTDSQSLGLFKIISSCLQLQQLTLFLYGCYNSIEGQKIIFNSISMLQQLEKFHINLASTVLNEESVFALVSNVQKCPILKHVGLHLNSCKIDSNCATILGEQIKLCTQIRYLSLGLIRNQNLKDASYLYRSIAQMIHLQELELLLEYSGVHEQSKKKINQNYLKCPRLIKCFYQA